MHLHKERRVAAEATTGVAQPEQHKERNQDKSSDPWQHPNATLLRFDLFKVAHQRRSQRRFLLENLIGMQQREVSSNVNRGADKRETCQPLVQCNRVAGISRKEGAKRGRFQKAHKSIEHRHKGKRNQKVERNGSRTRRRQRAAERCGVERAGRVHAPDRQCDSEENQDKHHHVMRVQSHPARHATLIVATAARREHAHEKHHWQNLDKKREKRAQFDIVAQRRTIALAHQQAKENERHQRGEESRGAEKCAKQREAVMPLDIALSVGGEKSVARRLCAPHSAKERNGGDQDVEQVGKKQHHDQSIVCRIGKLIKQASHNSDDRRISHCEYR
jgi:hypothetical protein